MQDPSIMRISWRNKLAKLQKAAGSPEGVNSKSELAAYTAVMMMSVLPDDLNVEGNFQVNARKVEGNHAVMEITVNKEHAKFLVTFEEMGDA